MSALETLQRTLPDYARDLRLNLQNVLGDSSLTVAQRWGTAIASAGAARCEKLRDALIEAASSEVSDAVVEDALAAVTLMGMNNVYYRFRHLVAKPAYSEKPARLRMTRIGKPATNKVDFELFSLAVSAINACETCIRAHEQVVVDGGLSEDQVHEAVRIASVIAGCAAALELGPVPQSVPVLAEATATG